MPPKIKINETEYINFCILRSDGFVTALKYIKGIECLCCHSYMCKINWTPGLNLNHILIQINEYKKIKYYIALKILADKIKEKYLNSYIDLDSWLYLIQKS